MVKAKSREILYVLMNGYWVGSLEQDNTGAMIFRYVEEWLETPGARPLSLSLPLRSAAYAGRQVYNFFDNLLPDSQAIRDRIQARFQTRTDQPFDLLSAVGADCVGAVQLCTHLPAPRVDQVAKTRLSESDIAKILRGYRMSPLGMVKVVDDFRISIAGAQEKTALLWHNEQWCLPSGPTPTSHILKLPIGFIRNNSIDLNESCENEWLCLEIAKAFDLPVASAAIQQFEDIKVLVVERFDRRWSSDGRWLMRLPQEDMCQALGVAPSRKYQSDGGPGIAEIMNLLLGSKHAKEDREQFFRAQILFWLLAATDGHAKNFSIFLEPNGGYRLTPLYDVISVYPSMATRAIPKQKAKMAMALRGKKNRYEWSQIQPRHFVFTAKAANFSQKQAMGLLLKTLEQAETVAKEVTERLPKDFPAHISAPILDGIVTLARQHLPMVYQMLEDYAKEGFYEFAIALYTEAISIKSELGDVSGQATLLSRIARVYNCQGDVDNAIECYTRSLEISTQTNDPRCKAAALHAIADIYNDQDKSEHAIAFYEKSLALEDQLENWQRKAHTLHQLGGIYTSQGNLDIALLSLKRALELEEQTENIQGKAATLHRIASIYAKQGDLDKALSRYKKSFSISKQTGDRKGKVETAVMMAGIYYQKGKVKNALSLYKASLCFQNQNGYIQAEAATWHQMATIYSEQGEFEKARSYYSKSLDLKEQIGSSRGRAATLSMLGILLADHYDDFETALRYLQEALEILQRLKSPDAVTVQKSLSRIQKLANISL